MDRGSRLHSGSGGAYRRILTLAKGGMGTVELALKHDGSFRRLYAVKRLREAFEDDADVRAMFVDEARLAGLIRHPNVVSVLDVGEDDSGPFLVMELIEGVSVSTLLIALAKERRHLPLPLVLRIVADAARGLHAAHELRTPEGEALGLVHRDVSPQNILLGFDGGVRVTDFGVAKALGRLTKTDAGLLKGKMGYMSPEQLRFLDVDRRSDLFSLGIVTYELLTSSRLYGSDDPTPAPRRILEQGPPDPGEQRPDLPVELVELVFELLAKDRELRPESAREVADRLDAIRVRIEAEEGTHDLADYLRERFAALRRQREAEVATALRGLAEDDARPPRPSLARRAAIPAVLLAVIAAVATAVALSGTDGAPDEASRARDAARTAPPERARAPAEPPARDEPDGPAAEEAAPPERPRTRPHRRTRTSAMAVEPAPNRAPTGMQTQPDLWEW